MIEINIPDTASLNLQHLVLDYNGTLAGDGRLLPGVEPRLMALAERLQLHVVTADTFGQAKEALHNLPCILSILATARQAEAKLAYVNRLGASACACIGNGRNDRLMLNVAALGIAVIQEEGAAAGTLLAADVVTTGILAALDLLINPLRLVATLRE
jgi:soluble P-type ATPase